MTDSNRPDRQKSEAFVRKVESDVGGAMATILAILGDRLGLFKDLAEKGPATAGELARRTGTQERYCREWLGGMTTAGYLEYAPSTGVFTLPREHAPALAQEGGPYFFGGTYAMFPAGVGVLDAITEAFRSGGGVPQSAYDPRFWDGLERSTRCAFDNHLVQVWVPAMPEVAAKLEAGAEMADVGCGRGRALILLAERFPRSRFVGYDAFAPTIEAATARARAAGVSDRVRFEALDGARGLPRKFDLVSTFDVIHDSVDPLGLLRQIRGALKDDGLYVCLDINSSHDLQKNVGPRGTLFHGYSLTYCMVTSLAHGGAGLGTLGFHEVKARELCAEAGFSRLRRVPLDNPFSILYEVRP
jgi:SAM-dependent methyltransferase